MKSLIDFFTSLGAWNWFVVAAVMTLLESIIPGVHFMWFGIAAVIIGVLVLVLMTVLALPLSLPTQLVLFAVLSMAIIYYARRYWSPQDIKTDSPDLNERGLQYVGRTVTVIEAIHRGRGKVRVGDTVWTAEGPDLPEGARAKVTGANGIVLVVADK